MSDRRSRIAVRCAHPGCPHVGMFQTSRNLCPPHYRELVDATAAAVRRATLPTDE